MDGVIEGSVQRENGRVKVLIQLIHGSTDTHLWARDYERALTDVLKLQGEMARAIADEIRTQVTPEERARLASAATVNPDAHEAYLLGRYHFWKHIIDDHKRAIDHFERAIQIDPGYAAAYAGLSMAWQKWGVQRPATKGVEPQARAAARKLWSWMTGSLKPTPPRAFSSFSMTGIGEVGKTQSSGLSNWIPTIWMLTTTMRSY